MSPPPNPSTVRLLRWSILLLLVASGCAFLVRGADRPADPYLEPPPGTAAAAGAVPSRTPLPGFGEIAFRVDGVGAGASLRCALLAATETQRARGLMEVTDLGGYDGMLFRFDSETSGAFYMKNTPMPLSIAFFDAEGRLVSATDMEPCLGRSDCPLYRSSAPYQYALEVPRGRLGSLGIGPGSAIRVGGECP